MKTPLLGALLVQAAFVAATASAAGDPTECLLASSRGQRFKDSHRLVEARDQLRICAAARCPAVVQADCAGWLVDVEKALPTVVVAAKSSSGSDLFDVKVTVDGEPLLSRLDGKSIPMNPGPHAFHFEGGDGATADQSVLVREGEKNQSVAVVLGASVSAANSSPSAAPVVPVATTPAEAAGSGSGWRTAGWVIGGLGVAGIALGAVSGIIAVSDKSSAHCDANNVCDPGTASGIKSAANVSNVGWIAGGVLLAGGLGLVLFAPGGRQVASVALRIAPVVTPGGGGLFAGGAW